NQGTLNVIGGRDFSTSGTLANSGTINVGAGSTLTSSALLTWTGGSIGGAGAVTASAGGGIQKEGAKTGPGLFGVRGDFGLASGKKLDLTGGKLIFEQGDLSAITQLIASGRNGNTLPLWDGAGIVTSQSSATGGTFTSIGVAPAGTDVLVMYT